MGRHHGFTLIEILIALVIFAILGVIVAVGLRSVLSVHDKIQAMNRRWQQLAIAMVTMRRDVSQMTVPLRQMSTANWPLIILRDGFVNPLSSAKRSDLITVRYQLHDGELIRQTRYGSRALLNQVMSFGVRFFWRDPKRKRGQLPRAVLISARLRRLGSFRLLVPVPATNQEPLKHEG